MCNNFLTVRDKKKKGKKCEETVIKFEFILSKSVKNEELRNCGSPTLKARNLNSATFFLSAIQKLIQ
jgi:hypothetical protein